MKSIACLLALITFWAKAGFALTVAAEKPGHIYLQGEEIKLAIAGTGSSLAWKVTDYFGHPVDGGTLPLRGTCVLLPRIKQPGYYELNLLEKNGETVSASLQTTFAIVVPVPLSPDSPFGAQTHFAQYNAPDLLEVMARGNISHIRDEQYWSMIEISGKYVFPEKLSAYMDAAKRLGITPLISLDWSHPNYDYTAGQFTGPHTENGRLGYAKYAQAVLEKYGNQLPAVEVWNEYNGGTFIQGPATANKGFFYAAMLKKTAELTKPDHPDLKILAGAVVPISQGFFRSIFENGAMPFADILSIHPYRDHPQGVELEIAELIELTKKYNAGIAKPIWATEFSANITKAEDRKKAAPYLVQMAAMLRTAGVERMYYYLTEEDNLFPFRGLVRKADDPAGKYVPNPAFVAYANVIGQLNGWTPAGRILTDLKTTTYVYKFTKGTETRHVLWAYAPAKLDLVSTAKLTQTDLMGATSDLPISDWKSRIVLGEDPVFLTGGISKFTDTDNPVLADSLSDFDKTEGSYSWYYGYAKLKSDATFQPKDFQEMTWEIGNNDSYRWKMPQADYPFIGVANQHPGNDVWAIRRWQSAKVGVVRVEGFAEVDEHSTDGVGLRVFLDGREVLTKIILPKQPFQFSIPDLAVEAGSQLDVALSGRDSIESDATNLTIRVSEMRK